MKAKLVLIILLQLSITASAFHADADDKKYNKLITQKENDNKEASRLIQLWYKGNGDTKKKISRYDIYSASIWTKQLEASREKAIRNGSNTTLFDLNIILSSAYHDQTKFEKALPILEQIYLNKEKLNKDQYENVLIKLEEEYRAFNYIEKAIKIRRERIENKFINTYWEIYRDCGLLEAAKKDFIQFEPLPPLESENRLHYYINLGELYFFLNQYDSAKLTFNKGIEEADQLLDKEYISKKIRLQNLHFWRGALIGNAAKCDISRGIYTDVLPNLYYDINMSKDDLDNKTDKMILLASVLVQKNQFSTAKKYIDSATNYMVGKTIKQVRLSLYNTKSKYFKAIGKIDSALYYIELYNEYNRTLNANLQKNQSVLLLAELEISNRRSELIESQASNLKYIVQTKTQKQQLLISLFSICIILAFMLGFYLNNKQKLKNKKQIEEQNISLLENSKKIHIQNSKNELLLKELHHRVKNNLQVMYSLINLQKRRNKEDETKEILSSVQNRIQTMALVHENLYNSASFDFIEISSYIRTLINHLHSIYKSEGKNIEVHFDIQSKLELPIEQVISIGLIVNEAISNAYKYAFKGRNEGKIDILIEERGEHVHIELKDDGPGFDVTAVKESSLGIKLIHIMCSQLSANYLMVQDHGILHKLDFKI